MALGIKEKWYDLNVGAKECFMHYTDTSHSEPWGNSITMLDIFFHLFTTLRTESRKLHMREVDSPQISDGKVQIKAEYITTGGGGAADNPNRRNLHSVQ